MTTFLFTCGEALIRSGASSASTTKTLLAIARRAGLHEVTVSVTLGQLTISFPAEGANSGVYTRTHEVPPGTLNIRWRSRAEEIVAAYLLHERSMEQAQQDLDSQIDSTFGIAQAWVAIGYGLLGAGFSTLLGGSVSTTLGATFTSAVISVIFWLLDRVKAPGIFAYALGGFAAVAISTIIGAIFSTEQIPVCIVSALAARLAGLAAYGAVQDAVTGWYLSALGRLMDALTCTAGLISGVAAGIEVIGPVVDGHNTYLQALSPDTGSWTASIVGACVVATGFALSSGGGPRRLMVICGIGGLGEAAYLTGLQVGMHDYVTISLAAALVGAVSTVVSKPIRLTSNAIMMVSLLPMFPGMMIYQGILGLVYSQPEASGTVLEAAVTTYCLTVGGVAGQYLVSETLWSHRKHQFRKSGSGTRFDKNMLDEFNSQDIMLPVFSRPFNEPEQ